MLTTDNASALIKVLPRSTRNVKVRILVGTIVDKQTVEPGTVLDVQEDDAARLIQYGRAELW
jgi:hypothetical protein